LRAIQPPFFPFTVMHAVNGIRTYDCQLRKKSAELGRGLKLGDRIELPEGAG
jgi:hypothetical protein